MDRTSERENTSSKRPREERDRDSTKDHKHRSRDLKHLDIDSHHRHRHRSDHHRSSRFDDRDAEYKRDVSHDDRDGDIDRHEKSAERRRREKSYEREGSRERNYRDSEYKRELSHEPRDDEDGNSDRHEKSIDRKKRERSYEREGSRERSVDERERESEYEIKKKKQKQREENEDEFVEKEKKRERRRFGDKAKGDDGNIETVKNGLGGGGGGTGTVNGSSSNANGVAPMSSTKTSTVMPESSLSPLPTKVSSISNTNENKGVSITRSHEVPGKSSTDGTTSAAGKSASLSLDALAKAKKALQMQKELSEKLKKISTLNKVTSVNRDASSPSRMQEGLKVQPTAGVTGSGQGTAPSASSTPGVPQSTTGVASVSGLGNIPNIEAVKRAQELAAKMGFRHDPQFAPLINLFPGQVPVEVTVPQKPAKAPVLRLDALGREIDEHGNVINVTKPSNLSTLKVNINKQKKEAFQILKPELEVDPDANPHFDPRMGINKNKLLRPKRPSFQFVEEGKLSKEAEIMRIKSRFGEERAKDMKAREALHAKAKAAPDINPNLIEVSERVITKEKPKETIPDTEWWDVPLLPTGKYGEIVDGVIPDLRLKVEKITFYVEHPRPIEPPAEPAGPPPQPLKLTKKEQKKLRTQRRLARERERQEMIRQGLLEPPKPKVKMSNLMKVLGSEATQDPTKLEKEIRTAAAEREQAHIDRNIARKLTPAERREKKERKLFDDPNTLETIVSVYKINDLSDKKTRFKVDVNAHENRLTGCVVITEGMCVVVVEGGSKSIKRYGKLMLRRINWAEAVKEDEDEDDNEEKPVNKCVLVWQGSVAKPSFHKFSAHECLTEAAARKVFADAGVGHYWDLALNFSEEQM